MGAKIFSKGARGESLGLGLRATTLVSGAEADPVMIVGTLISRHWTRREGFGAKAARDLSLTVTGRLGRPEAGRMEALLKVLMIGDERGEALCQQSCNNPTFSN
jgi:hypothetical protein